MAWENSHSSGQVSDDATGALAVATYMDLIGLTRVTAGATATLATLVAAGSSYGTAALDADLKKIVIVPDPATGVVNIALNANATANFPEVPSGGIEIPVTSTTAALIQLYAAVSGAVDVWQFG